MIELKIVPGDITALEVDAIVNAANRTLLGGGGVDGAIHAAAGPELRAECESLGGCDFGAAKITKGYRLPAKYVIHTVGPIWPTHGPDESRRLLASCYAACLVLANEYGLHSIAFPAISTGAYRFPLELATRVAHDSINEYLMQHPASIVTSILLVPHGSEATSTYQRIFPEALLGTE